MAVEAGGRVRPGHGSSGKFAHQRCSQPFSPSAPGPRGGPRPHPRSLTDAPARPLTAALLPLTPRPRCLLRVEDAGFCLAVLLGGRGRRPCSTSVRQARGRPGPGPSRLRGWVLFVGSGDGGTRPHLAGCTASCSPWQRHRFCSPAGLLGGRTYLAGGHTGVPRGTAAEIRERPHALLSAPPHLPS